MRARLKRHGLFFAAEATIQGLQFATGLLVVRSLPPEEYAGYFLCFAVINVVGVVANSGLLAGFNGVAGTSVGDKPRFARMLATLQRTRLQVLAFVLPVALALGATLLLSKSQAYTQILLRLALIGAYSGAAVAISVPTHALRLHGHYLALQKVMLGQEVVKLAGIGAIVLSKGGATAVLAASVTAQLVALALLNARSRREAWHGASPDPEVARELMRAYRQLLPNSVYYAFQGQLSTFFLGWFGGARAVADLGAVSRYARVTSLFEAYMRDVLSPRLSSCQGAPRLKLLARRYFAVALAAAVAIVALLLALRPVLIALLGPSYAYLRHGWVFPLFSFGVGLSFLIAAVAWANRARGWFSCSARFQIPGSGIGAIIGASCFDITTLQGVLLFAMCSQIPVLAVLILDWLFGAREMASA